MAQISVVERLKIYTRYIGQKVILIPMDDEFGAKGEGILTGVKLNSVQVYFNSQSRWIPLYDDFDLYEIKLVLKPLKMLTESIMQTANNLPVQNFITQYYIQLGFDMPLFFSPDHPCNCMYAEELGLATYDSLRLVRTPEQVVFQLK